MAKPTKALVERRLKEAVAHFWRVRAAQAKKGKKDQGERSSATGGRQLDELIDLCVNGLDKKLATICVGGSSVVLPGYFRPTKQWDLLVFSKGMLTAVLETKSHPGPSFGNNFNNRVEEAIGSASDLLEAFEEGGIPQSIKPWVGYLILVEDCPK